MVYYVVDIACLINLHLAYQ